MNRRFRLRKSSDFKLVRGQGRSWTHPLLVLYARPSASETTRVGFSVGKRIGKAVQRNRVKRLMREAVRARLPALARGWDLVFIARARIVGSPFGQVGAAIEQLLSRAALWSPRQAVPAELPGEQAPGKMDGGEGVG